MKSQLKKIIGILPIIMILMSVLFGCPTSTNVANEYTVTFEKNSEEASGSMESLIIEENKTSKLTLCTFTRTGYTFVGWALTASATDVVYTDGADFTMGDTDVNLYAVWTLSPIVIPEYSVTLKMNEGSIVDEYFVDKESIDTDDRFVITREANTELKLPSVFEIVKDGYVLDGWYEDASFSGNLVTTVNASVSEDKTYYARWIQGMICDSEAAIAEISALTEGEYKYVIEGEIIIDDLSDITYYLQNDNLKVDLDLSNAEIPDLQSAGIFMECTSLRSISIPECVTIIGPISFAGCINLTSIEIPGSVGYIGESAFCNCVNLASINLTENVEYIGVLAFAGCTSLKSIEIPNSVESIAESAFVECTSLLTIEIPDSVTSIEDYAFFGCTSLTTTEIPDSVKTIGCGVFENCSALTSVKFTDTSGIWYVTTGNLYEDGDEIEISDESINAENFTTTYCDCYWYKY